VQEKLSIIGAGISGVGAAILASQHNYNVFVSDSKAIKASDKSNFDHYNISWEENGHTSSKILSSDLIIKSPGISDNTDIMTEIYNKNIQIISEIEFASRFTSAKIIAITGTNGKTTTSLLISKILDNAGFDVLLAGNIGNSFAYSLSERDYDYIVLEISSFQLDNIVDFQPYISILLNITPDHLDRYKGNFSNYIESKLRITLNQNSKDYIIYNNDDLSLKSIKTKARKLPISLSSNISNDGGFYSNNKININLNNSKMTINKLALKGTHNIFNSMAAAMAARVFEVSDDVIRESLIDFENIEHRLEYVLTVHGVDFINDSKATNVNAAWYAIESMNKPFVWIIGGIDKGNDYSELIKVANKKNLKAIICLGDNNDKIVEAFKNKVVIEQANDMREAVMKSYNLSDTGDAVLLSPACASFDLFENFEHRGSEFKKMVREL
jgi:UDP-N-acetylmuramoylalanine--D-glutamate ligase|tara:strand:- start:4366 stop:5688 length:1323 start_codon:yes stop_codon:yes gene_type:complete